MCKINFTLPAIPQDATDDERRSIMFEALTNLDLSEVVEKRDKLTYLSWANCYSILKQVYPTATFHVVKNENGQPYFVDPNVGIMVFTELTIEGHTTECFLCVMDSKNKAMKLQPYQYQSFNSYKKEYETKTVNAATMFDINKTIWRCLVKNVAIATGIGLNIFQGEDLNDKASEEQNNVPQTQVSQRPAYQPQPAQTPQPQVPVDYVALKNSINATGDVAGLVSLYLENTQAIEANPEIKALLTARKKALQSLNA